MTADLKIKGDLFGIVGRTGLNLRGGIIDEEWLTSLSGSRGIEAYREMTDNEVDIGSVFGLMKDLLRQADYFATPAQLPIDALDDELAEAKRWADFIDENLDDMEHSFRYHLGEAFSCVPFGWSWFEVLYKKRKGPESEKPDERSKYNDGLIGWRAFAFRSQDSFQSWSFDNKTSELLGLVQSRVSLVVPRSKSLHYVVDGTKGNPEGRSVLRNIWRSWYYLKNLQEIEGVVYERGPGFPVGRVPPELLGSESDDTTTRDALLKALSCIRAGERMGILYPASTGMDGQPTGYDLQWLGATGQGQAPIRQAIVDYQKEILRGLRATFLSLGQNEHGSFALASAHTDIFATALGGICNTILDEINNVEIPRLLRYNGMTDPKYFPRIAHGDFEKQPLEEISNFLTPLLQVGALMPDEELENWLRERAGVPPRVHHSVTVIPESTKPAPASAPAPVPQEQTQEIKGVTSNK